MAKVLYLQSEWTNNVGNRFIDLGGIAALEAAGFDIIKTSVAAQNLFGTESPIRRVASHLPQSVINRLKPLVYDYAPDLTDIGVKRGDGVQIEVSDAVQMPSLIDAEFDYVAFSGMRLTQPSLSRVETTLLKLSDDVEYIMLGVGGSTYSTEEISWVKNWLQTHPPAAFSTRDSRAYEVYSDTVPTAHDGIDNAWFLPEAYDPQSLNRSFVVVNFDREPEPQLSIPEENVIRTGHKVRNVPQRYFDRSNLLLSSFPEEYLDLYAGAEAVHTDRLHGFIPALAYGTPSSYHLDAPKNVMFDKLGIDDLSEVIEPAEINISPHKREVVEYLSSILKG